MILVSMGSTVAAICESIGRIVIKSAEMGGRIAWTICINGGSNAWISWRIGGSRELMSCVSIGNKAAANSASIGATAASASAIPFKNSSTNGMDASTVLSIIGISVFIASDMTGMMSVKALAIIVAIGKSDTSAVRFICSKAAPILSYLTSFIWSSAAAPS